MSTPSVAERINPTSQHYDPAFALLRKKAFAVHSFTRTLGDEMVDETHTLMVDGVESIVSIQVCGRSVYSVDSWNKDTREVTFHGDFRSLKAAKEYAINKHWELKA